MKSKFGRRAWTEEIESFGGTSPIPKSLPPPLPPKKRRPGVVALALATQREEDPAVGPIPVTRVSEGFVGLVNLILN